MTDQTIPFLVPPEERERFAALQGVEAALRNQAIAGLICDYRLIGPSGHQAERPLLGLVITAAGVPGEAWVLPVALRRQIVSTRAGDGHPALEQVGQILRNLGIAGVASTEQRYSPYPGDGATAYEVRLSEPVPPDIATAPSPGFAPSHLRLVGHEVSPDSDQIAQLIAGWVASARRQLPSGPREARALEPLRRLAATRRALVAGGDHRRTDTLRASGQLGAAWASAGLRAAFDPAQPATTTGVAPDDSERLRADLAALDPLLLLWHFPRDERGLLELGATVLLAAYEGVAPLGKGRDLWLAAVAPARRRDEQVVTVQILSLIGENHSHNWLGARWLWDAHDRAAPRTLRWGTDDPALATLGAEAWRGALADEADPAIGTAARCLLLQDAGRLREAFALYDIAIGDEVCRLLDGLPQSYAHHRDTEPWVRATQEGLRRCAPWLLGPLLREAIIAREGRGAARRGKWTSPLLRFFWLPHQTQQSKAALILRAASRQDQRPRLELESSASNARLPLVAWQRPIEIDLVRFGLLGEKELPEAWG